LLALRGRHLNTHTFSAAIAELKVLGRSEAADQAAGTSKAAGHYKRLGAGNAALWAPTVIAALQAVGRAARSRAPSKAGDKFRPYLELEEIRDEKALPEGRHVYKVRREFFYR